MSEHGVCMIIVCFSCAKEFVGTFLHCLESSNQEVVTSALKQLPELALLAQGNATASLLLIYAYSFCE